MSYKKGIYDKVLHHIGNYLHTHIFLDGIGVTESKHFLIGISTAMKIIEEDQHEIFNDKEYAIEKFKEVIVLFREVLGENKFDDVLNSTLDEEKQE